MSEQQGPSGAQGPMVPQGPEQVLPPSGPRRGGRGKSVLKYGATAVVALFIGVGIGSSGNGDSSSKAAADAKAAPVATATVTARSTVTAAPKPAVTVTKAATAAVNKTVKKPSTKKKTPTVSGDTVAYIVTGSNADVTYGPAGSDFNGHVPMTVTKPLGSPSYYAITAQLQGGGSVSCKIEVNGKVISKSTASGGYNIASCEITQDLFGDGWTDANS